jgi:hypothetical protein
LFLPILFLLSFLEFRWSFDFKSLSFLIRMCKLFFGCFVLDEGQTEVE